MQRERLRELGGVLKCTASRCDLKANKRDAQLGEEDPEVGKLRIKVVSGANPIRTRGSSDHLLVPEFRG